MKTRTLSLTFTDEGLKEFDKLGKLLGLPDRLAVFRRAVSLLEILTEQELEGGSVFVKNAEGVEKSLKIINPQYESL